MIHVFRLGPLEVGGGKSYAYCGLDADGRLIPPEITGTDAKGLGALAKGHAGQLNPGNHDDTVPSAAELKETCGNLRSFKKRYLDSTSLPRWPSAG